MVMGGTMELARNTVDWQGAAGAGPRRQERLAPQPGQASPRIGVPHPAQRTAVPPSSRRTVEATPGRRMPQREQNASVKGAGVLQ